MAEQSPTRARSASPLTGQTSSGPAAAQPSAHSLDIHWTELRRGRQRVLAPARVTLPVGAAVGLVGVNGAGKSTLLMALAGVLAVRGGQAAAIRDGLPVATMGYVPQRPALAQWLSVREALALQGADASTGLAGSPVAAFLAPLLNRRADALSGGQLQLAAVAGILARNDPLVLLDEPFAGVDLRHRAALVGCVAEHRRRNPDSVVVLASHLAADLHAICDWFITLRDGAVVFASPRNALPLASDETGSRDEPVDIDPGPIGVTVLERRLAALLNGSDHSSAAPQ